MKRSAVGCALVLLTASCARATDPGVISQPAAPSLSGALRERPRVAIVVLENKEYGAIIGNPAAPYINRLAERWALASSFYAITHPSLPNYLAMLGGDTFAIDSDCTTCRVGAPNLVDQLEEAGISWKAYMESMPAACFTGASAGTYAKKHNPFAYFESITGDPGRCAKVVPLRELADDWRARKLPTFVWVTPNLCHDMHDCSIARGDRFLAGLVPMLLAALGPRGVIFVTFDEGTTRAGCCAYASGGHIVTIAAGPGAKPGRYAQPMDHYSLLRAIEDRWKLDRLGLAASPRTPSLDAMLKP